MMNRSIVLILLVGLSSFVGGCSPNCDVACARDGLCASGSDGCYAASDEDCRRSDACSRWGNCTAGPFALSGRPPSTCGPGSDSDCMQSERCSERGICLIGDDALCSARPTPAVSTEQAETTLDNTQEPASSIIQLVPGNALNAQRLSCCCSRGIPPNLHFPEGDGGREGPRAAGGEYCYWFRPFRERDLPPDAHVRGRLRFGPGVPGFFVGVRSGSPDQFSYRAAPIGVLFSNGEIRWWDSLSGGGRPTFGTYSQHVDLDFELSVDDAGQMQFRTGSVRSSYTPCGLDTPFYLVVSKRLTGEDTLVELEIDGSALTPAQWAADNSGLGSQSGWVARDNGSVSSNTSCAFRRSDGTEAAIGGDVSHGHTEDSSSGRETDSLDRAIEWGIDQVTPESEGVHRDVQREAVRYMLDPGQDLEDLEDAARRVGEGE